MFFTTLGFMTGVLILLYICIRLSSEKKSLQEYVDNLTVVDCQQEEYKRALLQYDYLNSCFNRAAPSLYSEIIDQDGASLFLKDIQADDMIYVYYTEKSCLPCMELLFEELSKFKQNGGKYTVITSLRNKRDINVFKQKNKIEGLIYSINQNDEEESTQSILFTINGSSINNIFTPRKEFPDLLIQYLEESLKWSTNSLD